MIDSNEKISFRSAILLIKMMNNSIKDRKMLQFSAGWKILINLVRKSTAFSVDVARLSSHTLLKKCNLSRIPSSALEFD